MDLESSNDEEHAVVAVANNTNEPLTSIQTTVTTSSLERNNTDSHESVVNSYLRSYSDDFNHTSSFRDNTNQLVILQSKLKSKIEEVSKLKQNLYRTQLAYVIRRLETLMLSEEVLSLEEILLSAKRDAEDRTTYEADVLHDLKIQRDCAEMAVEDFFGKNIFVEELRYVEERMKKRNNQEPQ